MEVGINKERVWGSQVEVAAHRVMKLSVAVLGVVDEDDHTATTLSDRQVSLFSLVFFENSDSALTPSHGATTPPKLARDVAARMKVLTTVLLGHIHYATDHLKTCPCLHLYLKNFSSLKVRENPHKIVHGLGWIRFGLNS